MTQWEATLSSGSYTRTVYRLSCNGAARRHDSFLQCQSMDQRALTSIVDA